MTTQAHTGTDSLLGTCGIVVGSTDPDRLAAFYRTLLEPLGARWEEHMLNLADGMYIGFDHRDDIAGQGIEPGRHLLNITVRDIRAAEARLNELGARWIRPVEHSDYGFWVGTFEDPDGNYAQFMQIDGQD
ncbi:VOC family protein [Streptomyces sp. HNM0574]|uniref:VOC family protein n=1 Tax=Streptomyces sp. HNM0574 TaxID=2714954 RepID=UPI00146B7447|nr:VOC family protein [Streptomyces sp. HNM0574]NLU70830.1 VOC family protein [Streptomyces sp. HNM0574]